MNRANATTVFALVLLGAIVACSAVSSPTVTLQPTVLPATPTTKPPQPTLPPLTATFAQPTLVPTPTLVWQTYTDAAFGVTLQYPANWQPRTGYERKYAGADGFFQLDAIWGAGLTIDQVADNDAHHRLQPYGSQPTIERLQIEGREARLILPSADQPEAMEGQAGLIVDLPQPIEISGQRYNYLILWADQKHIRAIAAMLRLLKPVAPAAPMPSSSPTLASISDSVTCTVRVGQHPCSANVPIVDAKGLTQTVAVNYLLYLPDEYGQDPQKKWPLILFLHGSEERGTDPEIVRRQGLPSVLDRSGSFPFVVVSPQCPPGQWWWPQTYILGALLDAIESTYAVDNRRVYVTGLSMGGYGTWALAFRYPKRFAAIAPIAGGYYDGTDKLPGNICALKDLPIWAFHGALDSVVPPSESERMVNALKACGGNVRLTLYPEASHSESWELAYADPELYAWLLQQARE